MRTRTTLKRLSMFCAGAMLLACADLSERFALPEQARATRSADDAYALGRNYHLARRYEDAVRSYRAALAAEPMHINARNGLATLYAERRAFAQAIPIWRSLTENVTLSSGPGRAYLFSNLGYAYFLSGDYENATIALEKACLLDPLNHRAWHHLGETLQKLGQEERAQEMFRQAAALRDHDLRGDLAATGGTPVPAIDAAVKTVERPGQEWASTEIAKREDGMYELRRVPAVQVSVQDMVDAVVAPLAIRLPEPTRATIRETPMALLEIRNGNGVTGMAKALRSRMGDPGFKVTRLTNEKGFNVRQTRVEYQEGFRAAAERLAQRFDNASVVKVDNCKKTDMRLVIGRDIARPNFALRPVTQPAAGPTLADLASPVDAG